MDGRFVDKTPGKQAKTVPTQRVGERRQSPGAGFARPFPLRKWRFSSLLRGDPCVLGALARPAGPIHRLWTTNNRVERRFKAVSRRGAAVRRANFDGRLHLLGADRLVFALQLLD